jgi:hypothetical protein
MRLVTRALGVGLWCALWAAGCDDVPVAPLSTAGAGAGGEATASGDGGESTGPEQSGGAAPSGACQSKPKAGAALPDPTALDADQVARAAAVVGSCLPDDGVGRSAAHLWTGHAAADKFYYRFGAQLACLAEASCGCAAIEHCLGVSYDGPGVPAQNACDGEVFHGGGD